jgi:hypothetical protein
VYWLPVQEMVLSPETHVGLARRKVPLLEPFITTFIEAGKAFSIARYNPVVLFKVLC